MNKAWLLLVLALAGCDDLPQPRSKNEIQSIASTAPRVDIARLQGDIMALRAEIDRLKNVNDIQDKWIGNNLKSSEAIANQVIENANVANANAIRDMTRRGACGSRPIYRYMDDGSVASITVEKIPCTLNDLKK